MRTPDNWYAMAIIESINGHHGKVNAMPEPFSSVARYMAVHVNDTLNYMCVGDVGKVVDMVRSNGYMNDDAIYVMEHLWGSIIVDITDGAIVNNPNFIASVLELYLTGSVMMRAYYHHEYFGNEPQGCVREKADLVSIKAGRYFNTRNPDGLTVQPLSRVTVDERYDHLPSTGRMVFNPYE